MTEQEWRDKFGERLDTLIKRKGVSRNQFAEDVGIATQTVYKYARGGSTPSIDTILIMADYFGCGIRALVGVDEEPKFNKITVKGLSVYDWGHLFGLRLTGLIKFRGMTQKEFAEDVGINPISISKYKNCSAFPTIRMILAMANGLNFTVGDLMSVDEIWGL